MSSRLPRDGALEKGDKIDEMNKQKYLKIPPPPTPVSHLLQAQHVPALPYANVNSSQVKIE